MTTTTDHTERTRPAPLPGARVASWPLLLLAAPAFVAIWSGWVGLGDLTGFGVVHPLPGIADGVTLNTAITLPIGVETYAAYALKVWLTSGPDVPEVARRFARWSALGSLVLGAAGQVAYHLMTAAGMTSAPWQITAAVACLPVVVLGMGAALAHLVRHPTTPAETTAVESVPVETVPVETVPVETVPGTEGQPVVVVVDEAFALAGGGGERPAREARQRAPRPGVRSGGRSGSGTASRVARLRAQRPDLSAAEIARRLGVTDRTVRRYLAASGPDAQQQTDEQTDERTEAAA